MRQHFLKDYFSFTKKERAGIIILVSVVLALLIVPSFYPSFIKKENYSVTQFENEIAHLKMDSTNKSFYKNNKSDYVSDYPYAEGLHRPEKAEVFYFDPNTATVKDWIRLGIREKTALTIQKYIAKGGKFYKPEDIKKIWGLRPIDADRLLPYVNIKNGPKGYSETEGKEQVKSAFKFVPRLIQPVDINLGDTMEYIALPGIGSKLSQRIIAFREKLGGFYSIDQISETYLLPDSTFQKIKPYLRLTNSQVKKININLATVEEMKSHPYIKYNLANAIFQYRKQHGNFNSVEGIKKIMLVTDEMYDKVAPYLIIE